MGGRPSSEWRFHPDILRSHTDIDVVLHCHSAYAATLAVHHKTNPSFHHMAGTTIRCTRYAAFGTRTLSDAAPVVRPPRRHSAGLVRLCNADSAITVSGKGMIDLLRPSTL